MPIQKSLETYSMSLDTTNLVANVVDFIFSDDDIKYFQLAKRELLIMSL